jgi:protease-4
MGKNRLARFLILVGIFFIFFTIMLLTAGVFDSGNPPGDKLALIEINGTILGSEDIIQEIQGYKEDKSVKAIVLRIDSPGGVVAPTQEIYEELKLIKR